MRNIHFISLLVLFIAPACCSAADYNALWQKGNTFYSQKQYDSAAAYYEQIAALKPGNADIYYNLGNTYYRLNRIGAAVLNYERALKINPTHKTAKENLLLTRARISNHIHETEDIFFVNWWNALTRADRAMSWAICTFIVFAIFMLVLFLGRFTKQFAGRIPVQLTAGLFILFLCFLCISLATTLKSVRNTGAVVMQDDAPLMNKDLKGKPIVLIPEGTTLKIKSENAGWLEVALPDGRTGWLRQDLVSKI